MMLAALPVAALPQKPADVLVVGLGAGVTVWTARQLAEHVDVDEINPGVIDPISRFGLPDALTDVKVHIADARQHLALSDKKYDVITSEPSVPSEALAANLFTREFYELAATKLNDGGIYCQWLPGWLLTKQDARACIKTFSSVFDNVYLWRILDTDFLLQSARTLRYSLAR